MTHDYPFMTIGVTEFYEYIYGMDFFLFPPASLLEKKRGGEG